MITRVTKGNDFRGVLAYALMANKQPHVLCSTLKTHDRANWAVEFDLQASRNRRVKEQVYHYIKSLAPGEHLTDAQWAHCIAEDARALGFDQYVAVLHRDRAHDHADIVVNAVLADGRTWAQRQDRVKLRRTAQAQEIRYGLTRTRAVSDLPEIGKEEIEKADRLYGEGRTQTPIPAKLLVREAVLAACSQANDLGGAIRLLAAQGISTRTRVGDGVIVGVSFGFDGQAFSGTSIGLPLKTLLARLSNDHSDTNSTGPAPSMAKGIGQRNSPTSRGAIESETPANSQPHWRVGRFPQNLGSNITGRATQNLSRNPEGDSGDGVMRHATELLLLILAGLVRVSADVSTGRTSPFLRRRGLRPGIKFRL